MNPDPRTDGMKLDDWMQPDVILPVQFHDDCRALGDSERRLRIAVLRDAIRYVQRHLDSTDPRERALYDDAVEWISSPDRSEPFSFENVCDALDLDADYLRQRLCRWREAERARRAHGAAGTSPSRTERTHGPHLRAA